jgi:hypothetical protein
MKENDQTEKTAMSFEEDFNKALATAITMEEFTQHMYKRIEAWPWKENLSDRS